MFNRSWRFLIKYQDVIGVYLLGLGIACWYAFSSKFTTVADARNEYLIYLSYMDVGVAETFSIFTKSGYVLQLHSLTSTLFPALLSKVIPISPLLFYKIYIVVLAPLLPVSIYLLERTVWSKKYALACPLLIMSQTAYLQSASMFRTVIAIAVFAFILLVLLGAEGKRKYIYASLLAVLLVVTHYGTMLVAIVVLPPVVLYWMIKRQRRYAVGLVVLGVLAIGWVLWHPYLFRIAERTVEIQMGNNTVSTISESGNGTHTSNIIKEPAIRSQKDKIVQAALGNQSPDGDTVFQFSWSLFTLSWLTVMITGYGLLRAWRKLPHEFTIIGVTSIALLIVMVLGPYVSRLYGIERLWLQSLVVLSSAFIVGFTDIARRIKAPYWSMYVFIIALGWLNFQYGLIHSITGGLI